jgi:hypothetical protein
MDKFTRIPAYPLITHDPMFSVWSNMDVPTGEDVIHWSGIKKKLRGVITVDGDKYRFLGRPTCKTMPMIASEVTPLSTKFTFSADGVKLTVKFTSPLLMDDLDIMSTPITYISYDVSSVDGKEHDVSIELWAFADFCHSGEYEPPMRLEFFSEGSLNFGYMGQLRQNILGGSGDQVTCDWGYLFLASEDTIDEAPERIDIMLRHKKQGKGDFQSLLLIGYEDITSINYFGRILPSYHARNGKNIVEALKEFYDRREELLSRCDRFDEKLLAQARKKGGEDYALVLSAAYRQSVAAHKLVADVDGTPLFISKENDSNGCAATVDISYPSFPLFLLYQPELVRAMLRPILKFARMPIWRYDFAPHDVGRYPLLTGQVYGARQRAKHQAMGMAHAPYYLYPATVDAYLLNKQMPVEESADMLLMMSACARADGNYTMVEENLDLMRKWCRYLLEFGEDPGEQLCTDDFAGHLARNVNLSAKAIMGIAAFGQLLQAIGHADEAENYVTTAKEMAKSWLLRADMGGYTSLSFNGDGWSMKYNLVWDRLLGLELMPEEFYARELASYIPRMERYGLPLDSRAPYSKSDWIMWTAAMANDEQFPAFVAPLARYLKETDSRVPFSDYYDTQSGRYEKFIARSVQGGLFMPLLMEKWTTKQ